MDSLAATPLNALTTPGAHAPRRSSDKNQDDTGSFEEALGNELATIVPHTKSTGVDLLASATDPADDTDKTVASDGAQALQALLDAANVIPQAGPAAVAVSLEHLKAAKGHDTTPSRIAAAKEGRSTTAMPGDGSRTESPIAQTDEPAGSKTPAAATGATTAAEEMLRPHIPAAPVVPTTPATLPAMNHPVTPENVAAIHKNQSAAPKSAPAPTTAATAAATSPEARESRDATPSRPLDELLTRSEVTPERTHLDPLATPSIDKLASSETPSTANNVTSSLDALSSAALVSKWTAAPQANNVTAAHTASARIDTPVGSEGWGDAFTQKVVWLVDRHQQSAELHVNPPHLGPVEVVLNVSDDGARIAFCSPHASVREAIEASLADLRSALSERGLSLGQTLVSADPGNAREQLRDESAQAAQRSSGDSVDRGVTTEVQSVRAVRRGLVDIFA